MVIHSISMHSAWLRSTFLRVLKFLQIKEARPNFWGEPILQKVWIIWSSPSAFQFERFYGLILRHSLDFNGFCLIQEYFSQSLEISTNKRGGPSFWGEAILQKVWIILSPLLYLNFESFVDLNSSWFISFQRILRDSGVLFSGSWNF